MTPEPLDPALVATGRDLARDYILGALRSSGRFRYQVDFRTGELARDYNMLRHCGAIWAALAAPGLDDPRRLDPAVRYLLEQLRPFGPGVVMIERERIAKLGGSGLAMLALTAYRRRRAGDAVAAACAAAVMGLARGVVAMHRGDAVFDHKFDVTTGRVARFASDYYVGEALFGIADALLDGPASDPAAAAHRDFLLDAVRRLGRRDYGVAETSHWMLYALEAAARLDPDPALLDHAGRIVDALLREPQKAVRLRSTPTACRSEGLLAYLRQVAAQPDRTVAAGHAARAAAARQLLEDNLRAQLRFQGTDPRSRLLRGLLGGRNDLSIRIDHVQHNLSALSGYVALAESVN